MTSRSDRFSPASGCSTSLSNASPVGACCGSARSTLGGAPCCASGGPTPSGTATSPSCATRRTSTSSAAASPARTCPPLAGASVLSERDQDCGASTPGSSERSSPRSSLSRTSLVSNDAGSTKCSRASTSSATRHVEVDLRRVTSERRTAASACSFWPTPTRAEYGSSQNGSNSWRPSAKTPSIATLVRHDLWRPRGLQVSATSDGVRGLKIIRVVNPAFLELLMGAPPGWSDCVVPELPPSATPCALRKPRRP